MLLRRVDTGRPPAVEPTTNLVTELGFNREPSRSRPTLFQSTSTSRCSRPSRENLNIRIERSAYESHNRTKNSESLNLFQKELGPTHWSNMLRPRTTRWSTQCQETRAPLKRSNLAPCLRSTKLEWTNLSCRCLSIHFETKTNIRCPHRGEGSYTPI